MWPFKKNGKRCDANIGIIVPGLITYCEEAVPTFSKALSGEDTAGGNNKLQDSLFVELVIFGVHLMDRIVLFRNMSIHASFMDTLLPHLQDALEPGRKEKFQDLYNTRIMLYGKFQKLAAPENEAQEGSLFWEFGNAMAAVYANSNSDVVKPSSVAGIRLMSAVSQVLAKAEVV